MSAPTPTIPADAGVLDPRTGEHVTSVYRIAEAQPDRVAGIEASRRQVSYGELVDVIHSYARGLQALGLGAGDGIVLLAPNNSGSLEAYIAALDIAVYVAPGKWHPTGP